MKTYLVYSVPLVKERMKTLLCSLLLLNTMPLPLEDIQTHLYRKLQVSQPFVTARWGVPILSVGRVEVMSVYETRTRQLARVGGSVGRGFRPSAVSYKNGAPIRYDLSWPIWHEYDILVDPSWLRPQHIKVELFARETLCFEHVVSW